MPDTAAHAPDAVLAGAWDESVLRLVADLNRHLIEEIVRAAQGGGGLATPLVTSLRSQWLALNSDRIARTRGLSLPALRCGLREPGALARRGGRRGAGHDRGPDRSGSADAFRGRPRR